MDDRNFVISTNFLQAVAEALEQAKETIYIADWWLSPELVKPHDELFVSSSPLVVLETTAFL
jgi:hypothetical protein